MEGDALHGYYKFYPNDGTLEPGIAQLMSNNSGVGMAAYTPDVTFAEVDGRQLKLQLLLPWDRHNERPCPTIVFVQGSAWTDPDAYLELPQLARFAQRGFVVASITHRSSRVAPFPACLIDVKRAIRFLRAHAGEYCIDVNRIAIWGTSSGGNLALLTAATEGLSEYEEGDNLDQSSAVQAVVDFFGPTDVNKMVALMGHKLSDFNMVPNKEDNVLYTLIGGVEGDAEGRMAKLTPALYLKDDTKLPPHLIIHGDCDDVVPFSQSVDYYKVLRAHGVPVSMFKVNGAAHEYRFWGDEVLDVVMKFLYSYLV